jgi:hypothetical protein
MVLQIIFHLRYGHYWSEKLNNLVQSCGNGRDYRGLMVLQIIFHLGYLSCQIRKDISQEAPRFTKQIRLQVKNELYSL